MTPNMVCVHSCIAVCLYAHQKTCYECMVQSSQESGPELYIYCQFQKPEQKQMLMMTVVKGLMQISSLRHCISFVVVRQGLTICPGGLKLTL